jgi:DNA-binding response OmpR family regulator
MHILIIEDEEKLAQSLKKGLERSGYAVDYLLDGESGERRLNIRHKDYDFVILDLMLPGKSGFEVCKALRDRGITIPILILTARDTVDDKVSAFNNGADDYLTKPFSLEELLARIRAIGRRPNRVLEKELKVKDVVLDPNKREVYRGERKINLTLKEFELLSYLMRHPDQVLNREDIFIHLWDFADNSLSNTIDVHIKNLRSKLDDQDNEKLIETVRGVGYKIRG